MFRVGAHHLCHVVAMWVASFLMLPAHLHHVSCASSPFYDAHLTYLTRLIAHLHHTPSSNVPLQPFFQGLPKGADLHHHITGAVYAESLIDLGADADLCISPITYQLFEKQACNDTLIPLKSAYTSSTLYNAIIDAWSMRSMVGSRASQTPVQWSQVSPHDHFFAIFEKIDQATHAIGTILAKLRTRAAQESVSYLESMIQIPSAEQQVLQQYRTIVKTCSYAIQDIINVWNIMTASSEFQQLLQSVSDSLTSYRTYADKILYCNTPTPQLGCDTYTSWIYHIFRDAECETVVSQAILAFALASSYSPLIVGIQLVGPEDGYYARTDFKSHIQLLSTLMILNNNTNMALHAGELTSTLVPPEDLLTHISSSLSTGARRLGHVVSLLSEPDWNDTLTSMASHGVAVEMNLVSNEQLLDVMGDAHPFPIYMSFHVPCVLSTDDAGIMRTTLSEQFLVATQRYNLSYPQILTLVRNSLEYSFLPGQSLWQNKGDYTVPVAACSSLFTNPSSPSAACVSWVSRAGPLASLQLRLERDLFRWGNAIIRETQNMKFK